MEAIVGIDVGTTKICTLVGEVTEDQDIRVVGVGVVPSRGIRKGVVVDATEVSHALAASIERAEQISGYSIERAYVGVTGAHISSLNSRGVVAIGRGGRTIVPEDVYRALDAAQAIAVPHNQRIIHAIPRGYTVDEHDGVHDPVGLVGFRLEVEAHIVTGSATALQNLSKCLGNAGVEVEAFVFQPLAAAESVLTPEERDIGVVLVDMGGGTTDVAMYIQGSVWHSLVLEVGGHNLTRDIAVGLRSPFSTAESIKLEYGHAVPDAVDPHEAIQVLAFGEAERRTVLQAQLAEIIRMRLEEMLELVQRQVKRSGYDGLLPAGVVLTGGGSELPGLRELCRRVLRLPVRVGHPRRLGGLVETISGPSYAASVGLLLWGHGRNRAGVEPRTRPGSGGPVRRFFTWAKEVFLPR